MLFETDAALSYLFSEMAAAVPQPLGFNWAEVTRTTGDTPALYYARCTVTLLLGDAAATERATEQLRVAEATSSGYLGREPECRGARWQGHCLQVIPDSKRTTQQDKIDHEINLWTRPL